MSKMGADAESLRVCVLSLVNGQLLLLPSSNLVYTGIQRLNRRVSPNFSAPPQMLAHHFCSLGLRQQQQQCIREKPAKPYRSNKEARKRN